MIIDHFFFAKQLKKEGRRNEYERHKLQALNQRQKLASIYKLFHCYYVLDNGFAFHYKINLICDMKLSFYMFGKFEWFLSVYRLASPKCLLLCKYLICALNFDIEKIAYLKLLIIFNLQE